MSGCSGRRGLSYLQEVLYQASLAIEISSSPRERNLARQASATGPI